MSATASASPQSWYSRPRSPPLAYSRCCPRRVTKSPRTSGRQAADRCTAAIRPEAARSRAAGAPDRRKAMLTGGSAREYVPAQPDPADHQDEPTREVSARAAKHLRRGGPTTPDPSTRHLACTKRAGRDQPQDDVHARREGRDGTIKPQAPQHMNATARTTRWPGPSTSFARELSVG